MTHNFTPEQIEHMIEHALEVVRPEEDAAAAEEIARARNGRPPLAMDEPVVQITVRLPASLRDNFAHRAADEGMKMSELVREAMEHYLLAANEPELASLASQLDEMAAQLRQVAHTHA